MSSLEILGFYRKEAGDDSCCLFPILSLDAQLFATAARQSVEASPAIILRGSPLRGDRTFLLKLQQDGIKRALIHAKQVSTDLFDTFCDSVAMQWAEYV